MTLSLHTKLGPDTISLPAVAEFVGKEVRIIIVDEPLGHQPPDMSALDKIAGKIDLDFDAIEELRQRSIV